MSFAPECQVIRADYIDRHLAANASKPKFTILKMKTQARGSEVSCLIGRPDFIGAGQARKEAVLFLFSKKYFPAPWQGEVITVAYTRGRRSDGSVRLLPITSSSCIAKRLCLHISSPPTSAAVSFSRIVSVSLPCANTQPWTACQTPGMWCILAAGPWAAQGW